MCLACGTPFPSRDERGFRSLCPDCGRELHTCKNCAFFKPGVHYDCAETVQDPVFDKEKANLCEWWRPGNPKGVPGGSPGTEKRAEASAKAKFDELFK
ncbi:MAG: hypothetical protein NT080_13455 [Spirochaetes bacterium]|nr:hypothetical protein [Spirochaetota bacterium]